MRVGHLGRRARVGLVAGLLATGTVIGTSPMAAASHSPFTRPLVIPPELTGDNITLTAKVSDVQILDGAATQMWTFNGVFPGPTIRQQAGTAINVNVVNQLAAAQGPITVHNHGNHSTPENDGRPHEFLISPGSSRTYNYAGLENGAPERGTQQWYHDHTMEATARNVWMGLAGMYIIDDPADPQSLPTGEFDVPLMLVDRSFDASNQLSYSFKPSGVTGDHVLVNGVPQPYFEVGPAKYRLRILNASNVRDYTLALSNGASFTQIGTDSGLLPAPVSRSSMTIGPSERVDVVVDFSGLSQNATVRLRDLDNSGQDIMEFRLTRSVTNSASIPSQLRSWPDLTNEPIAATRTFVFDRSQGAWTINGLAFDPDRFDAQPVLGTTEEWTLVNPSGWTHVIHIHDVDQQLMSRNGAPPQAYELFKEAWHIGGGQTVVVRIKFTDHVGPYVFHCHVLEHEDDGMMSQFNVSTALADPISTGARDPAANTPATGDGFESTPEGAYSDGAGTASNQDGTGQSHVYSAYSLTDVPAGAEILGISVRADWWVDARRGTNSLGVALSSDGLTWTVEKVDPNGSNRQRTTSFGGADDLWGRTWTRADLDTLRVRVSTTSTIGSRDFFLDWLPITVYYR